MLGHLLVSCLGGYWRVRDRAQHSRWAATRAAWRLLGDLYLRENGSYIGAGATFDGPPTFPHGPKSVFITGGARLGRRCVIFQQVTIGSNTLPDSRTCGAPTLGDDCYIGAGAKIIGAVRIGHGCRIGANCVVVEDVPDGSVVVMPKPRIIPRGEMDNRHYAPTAEGWVRFDDGRPEPVTDPALLEKLRNTPRAA